MRWAKLCKVKCKSRYFKNINYWVESSWVKWVMDPHQLEKCEKVNSASKKECKIIYLMFIQGPT